MCSFAQAEPFSGKVVGIADGDTLTVLTASKQQHRVRLAEIDALEKSQPFGTKSKQPLSDLCFGKEVEIAPRVKDRYQRIIARVKCAGVDVKRRASQPRHGLGLSSLRKGP